MDYFLFIYLFFHFFKIIKTDCSDGCKIVNKQCTHIDNYLETCDIDCMPDLLEKKCFKCEGITASQFYYIRSETTCEKYDNCDSFGRIFYNTRQCADLCYRDKNVYILGTYCYLPAECEQGNRKIVNGACSCVELFSESIENGKKLIHCYSPGEYCGPEHTKYGKDSKKCETGSCEANELKKVIQRTGQSDITRCSTTCDTGEFEDDGYCLDKCPENKYIYSNSTTNKKSCVDKCDDGWFIKDGECVNSCTDYRYENSSCINVCNKPYYITKIGEDEKYCSLKCSYSVYKYIDTDNKNCVKSCSTTNKYIKNDNICIPDDNTDCYLKYTDESIDTEKECFSSCKESGMPYYISTKDHICYSSCQDTPNNHLHNEGEYECLSYCSVSYYQSGGVCYCYLYAIEDDKKVCYSDEAACKKDNKYNYRKGNECIKECKPYYEVGDGVDGNSYLKRCFDSTNECYSKHYYYYNTYMLKCWSTCPSDMFSTPVDSEGKPLPDLSGSTCISECGKDYPKHTYGTNVCKKECDNGEFYTLEEPNTCISKCNDTYPYIGEKNECLKVCENKKYNFTMVSGKYKCVSDCKKYGKFYIEDDPNCYDSCKDKNLYYYNSNHKCVSSCLYETDQFYYPKPARNPYPQPCKSSNENKFYYENKTIVDNCGSNYISQTNNLLCVEHCDSKFFYQKKCVASCPAEAPYINKTNDEINECISKCGTNQYVILFKNECINSCPAGYSINTTYKICYPNCKFGEKFNIDSGQCVTTCPNGNNYYEKTNIFGTPEIYVCRKSCIGTKKFIKDENDKECVINCPENNNFIKKDSNQCVSKCQSNEYFKNINSYPKSGSTSDYYYVSECLGSCPTDQGYFYVKDNGVVKKKCYDKCPSGFEFIVNKTQDKFICISACPSTYSFYLKNKKDTNKNFYTCLDYNPCSGINDFYYNGECITGARCKTNKFNFVENKACVSECSSANKFKTYDNTATITICKDYCKSEYFIDSENNCVIDCPEKENFINYKDGNKYCKAQCDNNTDYYISKSISAASGRNAYNIYNCTEFCKNNENDKYLKIEGSKECISSCPNTLYLSENERICYYNCTSSPNFKFTLTTTKKCNSSCDTNLKYYYENEKVCLSKCNNNDFAYASSDNDYLYKCINNCGLLPKEDNYFIYTSSSTNVQNNFCVKKCPSDKQYLLDNTCIEQCPSYKKFSIKELKHSGDDLQKKCYTDCPNEYPYYTIYNDNKGKKAYGCQNNCDEGYKVINFTDTNISAILCINDCPDKESDFHSEFEHYKFKIVEKNNKTCYSFCPPERPKHKDITKDEYKDDNNCYSECPEETPFTEVNELICKSEKDCSGQYIDYENKLCLPLGQTKCPENKKYMSKYKYGTNGVKYICLNSCIEKYGKYLSPYGTCVNNCETDDLVKDEDLINDPKNDKCICKHLYIINETLQMQCLKNSTSEMKCKNVSSIYHIKMFNSKECVKVCNNGNILSASEDICYNSSHECGVSDYPNDRNTHLITKTNGQKKYVCSYKFYNKTDEEYSNTQYPNLTICLDIDSLCPSGFGRYVPETKECLKTDENCPEDFSCLFQDIFCLRDCPKNSTYNSTGKYYQCVQPYEYWHETDRGSGNYECIDKCLDKYPVYAPATNQCLYECTDSYYPYVYQRKCYNSCNNSKILNIENGFITKITDTNSEDFRYGSYTCECHNPWFYNKVQKKICAESMIEYSITDCNNFTEPNPVPTYDHLVKRTLQCIDKCPKEFNYTFNKECFENCTEAAFYYHYVIEKENSNECVCQNLWFYEPNNYIQCIEPNVTECVVYDYEDKFFDKKYFDKKYLVNGTNECVNKCPSGSYSFNYVCYDKCPTYTQDNHTNHICRCNKHAGHWYEYERYNLTYLECAVEKCPANNNESAYIRENLLETEGKCLITCRENEEFPFSLRKVCVKECPYFTYTNDKPGELNDTCLFYDLGDDDVDTLEKFKAATSVQVMELYQNSEKTGGYLYDKFNTTLQIYAIDRNDSLKEISFKSNLTYIDFGTCFEKIMKDKNISENESILITKYDIMNETNVNIKPGVSENHIEDRYLINPVEYELYSSLTNQKLDALVCEPYEMLISYPLLLSKFDKYIDGINQNEYRKRFEIGKELNKIDNEIDTFNYNNTVYTHFCKELEINGKDLVFEDRYKYLYPNNKLLCESNCTFNNTDFEHERVNCLCTYKDVFDFYRKEEEINDILNNPDFYLPTQSSTNAEIIKCLFNFTLKQAIAKNEMFYCCTIVTVAQVVCILIISITSVKDMINDIRHILNKVNIKNYFLKKNKFFRNNKLKADNILSSTNRALNNPPRKNNNGDDDTEKNDNNINDTLDLDSEDNKKSKISEEIILDKNKIYSSTNNKAEYIPPDYNFKFFKPSDKGVIKQVERSEIPFDINPDTKYLIERRKGVDYADDYLYGPYLPNQNIVVVSNEKIHKIKNDKTLILNKTNNKDNLNKSKMEKASKKRNVKIFDNLNDINEKKFVVGKQMKSNLKAAQNDNDDFNPEKELRLTDEGTGFFGTIRREQIFLRVSFDKYMKKENKNIYIIFLAEIFDKIYFIKTCLFLRKFDIFYIQLSLYLFYHILLISLLCGFFTVNIIRKIWENDNFPDINFYLLYGLIAHIIVWIIYQLFSCVLDFHDRIKDMITLKSELIENQYTEDFDKDNIHDSNEGIYKEKYDELIYQIKCRISLFYVISFLFTLFFSIYLISFFSFYTGTKHRVLTAYYVSIIEILLIKIVYGTILASLRYASKIKGYKCLYNFVFILDKYFS